MKFRFIDSKETSPFLNMAIDESLLTSKLPVLRFYRWNPEAISLGYNQSIKTINKEFCRENRIEIVRRITGGNAVLHDKELTYSFIIDEILMHGSIIDSYRNISKGILAAFKFLGIDAEINQDMEKEKINRDMKKPPTKLNAICFNEPNWYEILINKKKAVGSAQKRVNGKILQHGSVLLDIDIEKYAHCFNNFDVEKMKNRITSINRELNKKINYEKLLEVLKKGFEKELDIKFIDSQLTEKELNSALELEKKYRSEEWNNRL